MYASPYDTSSKSLLVSTDIGLTWKSKSAPAYLDKIIISPTDPLSFIALSRIRDGDSADVRTVIISITDFNYLG